MHSLRINALLLWIVTCQATQLLAGNVQSFDLDHKLTSGMLLLDHEVAIDGVAAEVAAGLPDSTEVGSYAVTNKGIVYFTIHTTVDLGGVIAGPGDLLRRDPDGTLAVEIDAADLGLARGVNIDAVTLSTDPAFPFVLSFDTTVELPAPDQSITVDDEDLVRTDGSTSELYFDGSLAGLSTSVDLDAAHYEAHTGLLLISLDTSGEVDVVTFDDEDVLAYELSTNRWSLAIDHSRVEPNLGLGTDLDAFALDTCNTCDASVFSDGFESGDTSRWD